MQREDVKMLVQKWWDIYNDTSLDYKPLPPALPVEAMDIQPFIAALSEAGPLKFVTAPSAA